MISPHNHCESALSGSTLPSMIKQAKALGRDYFACTDHGHLSLILKAYNMSKKAGLKFIPGLEFYFKDTKCPLTAGTSADRCKYYTATIYCQDQTAYQELCKMVSRTDMPTMEFYEEKQQLWQWADIEQISKFNTQLVLSGVHCIVGKTMLADNPEAGEKVFLRLKELFNSRLSVALLAEPWLKKFSSVVEINYVDGTRDSILSTDRVSTDRARSMEAKDLVGGFNKHKSIKSKSVGMMNFEIGKDIEKVILHKGFLPLPGGDTSLKVNKFLLDLANKYSVSILATDYAYYATKEDKIVQTMRLEGNNKLHPNLHMKSEQEIRDYLTNIMVLTPDNVNYIIQNNNNWAKLFDNFSLKYELQLVNCDENPYKKTMDIIKKKGRMEWNNTIWVERLKEEFAVIAKNPVKNLLPYFFPIIEINEFCRENQILIGSSRGSVGGSLLCYLMGVTNLNPMKYNLSFSRFLSLDRIKNGDFPDVDSDFSDKSKLIGEDGKSGFLVEKYGSGFAQIGTKSMIRLKSAIKDANRYTNGEVEPEIEILTKSLPAPPQGVSDEKFVFGYEDDDGNHIKGLLDISDDLQKYTKKRPDEWSMVRKAIGIVRSKSIHACGAVLSSFPIKDIAPLREGYITQYEAKEVESCGLLKYDILKVSQILDIEVCLKLINKKHNDNLEIGYFNHNGQKLYIWDLPEIEEVFKSIWSGDTATIFQLHTTSMTPFVKDILPRSVEDISTILALVRPGPLDYIDEKTGRNMAEEYVWRRRGDSKSDFQELYDIIPETYGTIVFQEQQLKIAKEVGGMAPDQAENLRRLFAKKKKVEADAMKPIFMNTAVQKIGKEKANKLWAMMETFARYSFNCAHSTAYAVTSYACMFLKYYYPLEWWAAILTNATEKEITGVLWPYVKDIVLPPDINLSSDVMAVDYINSTLRSKLGIIRGMGEKSIDPIVAGRPYVDIRDYVDKGVAGESLTHKLVHIGVLDSLFPPTTNLLEKLKLYQEAVQNKDYSDKVKLAEKERRKIRALAPKPAVIPAEYINLHPMKDAAMRKDVLPSLPIDLYALGSKYSKVLHKSTDRPAVTSKNKYRTLLLNGEQLKRLDELEGSSINEDIYVAATCYVLETKEFSYAKNTKKALKLNLAADSYVSEKVLWPDYNTGSLMYPSTLKKGAICTIFFKKRSGKKDMSITEIVVET